MDQYAMINCLGGAFADGEIDGLQDLLAEDCSYASQYDGSSISGAVQIAAKIKSFNADIDDSCRYTYKITELESVMQKGMTLSDLDTRASMHPCRYGILLYQYGAEKPVAVVVCMLDLYEKFGNIWLCRDKSKFDLSFYGDEIENDSPADLPSTVKPLTARDREVAELQSVFSGQRQTSASEEDDNIYIWRKADEYAKQELPSRGYKILESAVFKDCIAYRCERKNYYYTVFMYAYGKEKTSQLDGKFCSKLQDLLFAADSTILILYLNVERYMDAAAVAYQIRDYCGNNEHEPELWRLNAIGNMPILEYFPRKEMMDQTWQFMYAFNREDTDVYDCIITDNNPLIEYRIKHNGRFMNEAFYNVLRMTHQKYGDMKLGYVRFNDVVFCSVPYLEGLGFFSWSSYFDTGRMFNFICHSFEGENSNVVEFIKTELREPEDLFSHIPTLVAVAPLPPVSSERFAAKLFFDNGERRKYVLPIAARYEAQEVVPYMRHVFTDGIWQSISVVPRHENRYLGYPECGSAIIFKNEFTLSGMRCYMDSLPYSEPELTDEIVYDDDKCQVRKLWKWNANELYEDGNTGLLKVLISGESFNGYGKSVFASMDGRRLTSLTFDLVDDFKDELARVAIIGCGYGFVDRDMNFVVPMKYTEAQEFAGGRAKVRLGDKWLFVDTAGKEIPVVSQALSAQYEDVGIYCEGMCRVSTLKLRALDLAYHSDSAHIAGTWGFVDEAGKEVIAPQYIYANDFENGIAIVAKGKWTIDPKWDNKYNQGRYWTEEELWGGIDKNGSEVIPCIFDEIKYFSDCSDIYMAHIGGWESGRWGVIDQAGGWLAEPVFADFGYDYHDGLITFYAQNESLDPDDVPMGVYDLKQKKVLFEPQFLDVSFLEDGDLLVEIFDKALGRNIQKIIDRSGKERFKSVYSYIYTWKEPYEVVIHDGTGDRCGLIDKDGKVILPCKYPAAWNGFLHERRCIIFEENGKQGVMDYDENVVIPAVYHEIHGGKDPFLTVRVGEKDSYKESLIAVDGTEVIPPAYSRIGWCQDGKHFYCCSEGCCEMYLIENK